MAENYTPEQLDDLADAIAAGERFTGPEATAALRAFAATLRQQAGRVDEGRGEALFYVQDRPVYRGDKLLHPDTYATGRNVTAEFRAKGDTVTVRTENGAVPTVRVSDLSWPIAALAQNTQGDGEPVAEVRKGAFGIHYIACADPQKLPAGTKLHLHAERARVPDGWVPRAVAEVAQGDLHMLKKAIEARDPWPELLVRVTDTERDLRTALAAATAQRAEVK